ncbi:hypothetical protein D477_003153 [Arthrobacter crystallopoietes BAB-32]|uniref:DUF7455 domain-containing protein n=1 Tax=Arthrobacter crystallopoietes BAB-32 TaxID=1246476 RepID=N1V6L2_9MICC|nr:hypothetical protein [Arthrobacter crystallopoietes]EMY35659.1 hypothetical protein D477_003153 [Arthrobacter crystallopoietes BAB-32]
MNTATETVTEAVISPRAALLNEHLKTQDAASPLNYTHDRCDRCGTAAAAKSWFTYSVGDIMLCGHHTLFHLDALLEQNPVSYWIEPEVLAPIKSVIVPKQDFTKGGDGLTDAS